MAPTKEPTASDLRLLVLAPSAERDQIQEKSPNAEGTSYRDSKELLSAFLEGLTGSAPSNDLTTLAGYTSHPPLRIQNKYYAADVGLWCDELPHVTAPAQKQESPDLDQWTEQMLSAEAKEAREVIGGIILVLPHVHTPEATRENQKLDAEKYMRYIKPVNELRDSIEDESGRDVATVVVVQDMTPKAMRRAEREGAAGITSFTETVEETCLSGHGIFGWDIVPWQPQFVLSSKDEVNAEKSSDRPQHDLNERSRNEYGERIGMARILEILEQTNWSAAINDADGDEGYGLLSTDDILDSDDEFMVPGLKPKINLQPNGTKDAVTEQSDEFQREIMGLHFALEEQSQQQTGDDRDSGDDLQVEQLAGLMDRVMASRDAAADMSRADREKFARREVSKIMREMS